MLKDYKLEQDPPVVALGNGAYQAKKNSKIKITNRSTGAFTERRVSKGKIFTVNPGYQVSARKLD